MNTSRFIPILICLSVLALPGIVTAQGVANFNWIMTGDSPLLDRSTAYLARGYTKLGIRYAHKALARSRSPLKDLIGNHNLCIALTMAGDVETASSHCKKVEAAGIPHLSLRKIKDGLYKLRRRHAVDGADTVIETLITGNLTNLTGREQVSQVDSAIEHSK